MNGSGTQLREAPSSARDAVQVPGTKSTLGENLLLCHDRASGLSAAIAVDDTTLGPGLGGVRWKSYGSFDAAVDEACRLARVMTLKNALAHIPYGGAKSVMLRQGEGGWTQPGRTAQLLAFAGFVNRLGGAYIAGVDMGTSVTDLATIASASPWASCDHIDPSSATAEGVFLAITAAVRQCFHRDLSGIRVVVQGVGHVGAALAEHLVEGGATVVVSDVDPVRAATVAHRIGGITIAPEVAHLQPCDVFAPCGPARVLNARSIDALRCALVVGAANDILSERSDAALLAERGITYVPDFVANAGGVIQIHSERAKWDREELTQALMGIGQLTTQLLQSADHDHVLPLTVAEALASDRLGHLVTIPD